MRQRLDALERERTEMRVQIDALNTALVEEREQRLMDRGRLTELRHQLESVAHRPMVTQLVNATGQSQAVSFPTALAMSPLSHAMADSPPSASGQPPPMARRTA